MTGTKRAVAAAGIVAVIAAVLIAWAVQASSDSKRSFTLDGKVTAYDAVDLAPSGDSPGDLGVLAGDLTRDGNAAGTYQGYCISITDPSNSQCSFTLALDDGQIVISTGYGEFNGAEDTSRDPIVGGTGAYSDARGWAEGKETGEETVRYVIHLEK
ncbi:MAG: hypothetical protein ACRD03_15620 [Acidimicrobiales bacterium]